MLSKEKSENNKEQRLSATHAKRSMFKSFIISSAAACCATVVSTPIEMIKTRMQFQGELGENALPYKNPIHGIYQVIKYEGFFSLYKGLVPAFLFTIAINGTRLSTYPFIKNKLNAFPNQKHYLLKNICASSVSGIFGALLANPFQILKVRFQNISKNQATAVGYQHKAGGTIQMLKQISKEGGIFKGLWRGQKVLLSKFLVSSITQLVTYDFCSTKQKKYFPQMKDWLIHMNSSICSAVLTVICINPLDVINSRITNQPVNEVTGQGLYYKNYIDAFQKIYKSEGIRAFQKGLPANCSRAIPHFVCLFYFWETFSKMAKKYNF